MSSRGEETVISLDMAALYQFKQEDLELDVTTVRYSGDHFVQFTENDLFIDFLELPGVRKEGKMKVNTTRIYLTHNVAKCLAKTLTDALNDLEEEGPD